MSGSCKFWQCPALGCLFPFVDTMVLHLSSSFSGELAVNSDIYRSNHGNAWNNTPSCYPLIAKDAPNRASRRRQFGTGKGAENPCMKMKLLLCGVWTCSCSSTGFIMSMHLPTRCGLQRTVVGWALYFIRVIPRKPRLPTRNHCMIAWIIFKPVL